MENIQNMMLSEIEGIGPVLEKAFNKYGMYTLVDLFRHPLARLHVPVTADASQEQVEAWRGMAELIQIEGLNAQWAEGLVKGGVSSLVGFAQAKYEKIREALYEAKNKNIIPDVPDEAALYEFGKLAVHIVTSGMLNGTVYDEGGKPVTNARISIGHSATTSNTQGHFRLINVSLTSKAPLIISHPDHDTLVQDEPPPIRAYGFTFEMLKITLLARRTAAEPEWIDERKGKTIPQLQGHVVHRQQVPYELLQDGDLLMVNYFYASGKEVKLVSLLKEYSQGEFRVHYTRVPLEHLPGDVKRQDCLIYRGGKFSRYSSKPQSIYRYKAVLRAARSLPTSEPAATPEAREEIMKKWLQALAENGYFGKPAR